MDLSCNEIVNLKEVESDDCENKFGYESAARHQPQQQSYHHQPQRPTNQQQQVQVQQTQQQQQPRQQVTKKNPVITKLYFDACEDPTFLNDRCLNNLLVSEKRYPTPSTYYFNTIQRNLTPNMRKLVAEWTIELCEEEKCQEEVAILAINYMDRVLNKIAFSKSNLQLLAATCIFLASKLREPSARALPAHILVYYTDNSITKRDIMNTELLVLSCLKWDVSCVTPLDFLELLITRLPILNKNCKNILPETIRKHSQAYISLAIKETDFSVYSASNIAAASIAASLMGLNWHVKSNISIYDLIDKLSELTKCETENIIKCVNKMEMLYQEQKQMFILAAQQMKQPLKEQKHNQQMTNVGNNNNNSNFRQSTNSLDSSDQNSITPNDIQDVDF